ncbi:hypothetical protein [Deinococcus actinosclerus]|uniref:Uncharacterized protein n=1 Tax=Deinococcus actinosclerus TaxID=1768108 RepID=A0ABM5X668_9DEIO|nr:hypothetical protein [Deinococcus actinosclerus]ALW89177.1 hypothetical protein AUC44_09945 [Deinococcus actinosclerus]
MFPDFTKYIPMLQSGLDDMKNCLAHLYAEAKATREATQAQQRALAFEFGVMDVQDTSRVAPRRLTQLPVIVEAETADRKEIDVEGLNQGRAVSRGFYANLGDGPFKVTLMGLGGQASTSHTVPPGTTISLTCLISKVIIDVVDGEPAKYQLYMQ